MSHLSLQFAPATQGMSNAFGAGSVSPLSTLGGLTPPALEMAENARTGTGGASSHYQLPSGIASLEHWLDLNA